MLHWNCRVHTNLVDFRNDLNRDYRHHHRATRLSIQRHRSLRCDAHQSDVRNDETRCDSPSDDVVIALSRMQTCSAKNGASSGASGTELSSSRSINRPLLGVVYVWPVITVMFSQRIKKEEKRMCIRLVWIFNDGSVCVCVVCRSPELQYRYRARCYRTVPNDSSPSRVASSQSSAVFTTSARSCWRSV